MRTKLLVVGPANLTLTQCPQLSPSLSPGLPTATPYPGPYAVQRTPDSTAPTPNALSCHTASRSPPQVLLFWAQPRNRILLACLGVTIEGIHYRGAEFIEEKDLGGRSNSWYRVTLREGKNREIRKLFEHFGCLVNRLIRVQYGPFLLDELKTGEVKEVSPQVVARFAEELMRDKVNL